MTQAIIDVHSHPLLPAYLKLLEKEFGTLAGKPNAYGSPLPDWSSAQQIDVMDAHDIGAAILSYPSIGDMLTGPDGAATARAMNEELAATIAAYPNRLGGFATVPMDDMDAAIAETAYALEVLRLDGIGISTHCRGAYLGDPVYDPWLAELDRRGVTLFVHPTHPAYFDFRASHLNVAVLEFMFDTTRMVTNMVLSGAKARFPGINIIATHGGGTIPYLATRIAMMGQMPGIFRDGPAQTKAQIDGLIRSFYYDLTAATFPVSLNAIRDAIGVDQLLMGFDYPMMPAQAIAPGIGMLAANPGLDEAAKVKIRRGNALKLFPRFG